MMKFNDQNREGSAASSCRDKGRGWVDAGALCLSWSHDDSGGF